MEGEGYNGKKDMIEEICIIGGLIGVQFVYAGNSEVLSYLLSIGLQPSSLIISSTFATFLVLFPLAFIFERKKWPKKFSCKFLIQLVLIAFAGVTLFQSLMLKGIHLTSPAIATAMPNLAPGFIFIIAWASSLEKVKLNCKYSKLKIAGTLLCVIGALTMSLTQSAIDGHTAKESRLHASPYPQAYAHFFIFDKDKIFGCFYLISAVVVLSSNVVLQAATLGEFPAPISLCCITSLFGVIITEIVELIQHQKIETGWNGMSLKYFIVYALLSGCVSGACVSFNGWAMEKRGPVLVSMFCPIGSVVAVILSAFMGQPIGVGSLLGMFIMFTGVYFVLWAKGKEGIFTEEVGKIDAIIRECDMEKALLS